MKGEALGGLGSNTGKSAQLVDELLDRGTEHALRGASGWGVAKTGNEPALERQTWDVETGRDPPELLVGEFLRRTQGLVGGGHDHVLQHLHVFRVHGSRVDLDA